jgi:hypothetical protein
MLYLQHVSSVVQFSPILDVTQNNVIAGLTNQLIWFTVYVDY